MINWISVKDKLPKIGGENNPVYASKWLLCCDTFDEEWYKARFVKIPKKQCWKNEDGEVINITHWAEDVLLPNGEQCREK